MKKVLAILIPLLIIISLGVCFFLYNYTEVFGKKILPLKVNSVSLKYYPNKMDNILDKDGKNIVLEQEVKFNNDDIKKISSLFRCIKNNKKNSKNSSVLAKVVVNKDYTLYISEKEGYVENGKNKTSVTIPNNLYNFIYDKIDKNNEKIFEKFDFKKIVIHGDGAKIDVSDKDNLKIIKDSIRYLPIVMDEDFTKYNEGYKYMLEVDAEKRLFIYDNNVGYLTFSNDSALNKYVIFVDDVYELIDKIFSISTDKEKK